MMVIYIARNRTIDKIPDIGVWYRSDDGMTADGFTRVTNWNSRAGRAINFADSGSTRPGYGAGSGSSGVNGFDTCRIAPAGGVDLKYFQISGQNLFRNVPGATIASVFRFRGSGGSGSATIGGAVLGTLKSSLALHRTTATNRFVSFTWRMANSDTRNVVVGPAAVANTVYLAIGRVSYVSGNLFADVYVNGTTYTGTAPSTAGTTADTATTMCMGLDPQDLTSFNIESLDITEIIAWDRCVELAERDIIEAYLKGRYALTY